MSMYIRLKRKNQTLFLHVEPHQSFAQIKSRIGETFKIETDKILLFAQDKVLHSSLKIAVVSLIDIILFHL